MIMSEIAKRVRAGEKVKCPLCHKGTIRPIGDPKTTHFFECDYCKRHISETAKH